jgi:CHAD domain-containing protein
MTRRTQKLDADETLKTSLRIIFHKQAEDMFSCEEELLSTSTPDTVHDMRVAVRKMRALLRIFNTVFRRKELKKHVQVLSLLVQSLGRVRDCDIIINNLTTLRHMLSIDEQAPFDVLIGRQLSIRNKHSMTLTKEIERLHAKDFKKTLLGFFKTSLA